MANVFLRCPCTLFRRSCIIFSLFFFFFLMICRPLLLRYNSPGSLGNLRTLSAHHVNSFQKRRSQTSFVRLRMSGFSAFSSELVEESRRERRLEEREGFEPSIPILIRITAFEAATFNRSATSPIPLLARKTKTILSYIIPYSIVFKSLMHDNLVS